uniref:OB domain-containing protein n=1 Tax=Anopheles stephensi TaxID=30069 RepID=A0A182YLB6_ANOST
MQNHPPPNPNPIDLMAIKDIYPGMKNINVIFIILEIGPVTLTKENREVRTFKVADQSAAINVSIWDEPGKQLLPGDIVRLTKGYANVWRQSLTLYSGKNGEIVRLGDFCYTFNEMVNMSEPNPNLSASIPQPVLNNGSGGGGGGGPNGGNSNNGTGKSMGGAPKIGTQQQSATFRWWPTATETACRHDTLLGSGGSSSSSRLTAQHHETDAEKLSPNRPKQPSQKHRSER